MSLSMITNLIVAVDRAYGIGKNNTIPWHYTKDMNHFAKVTKAASSNKINAVIMGKNTWKSVPKQYRGFKDRYNVVVSSTMSDLEVSNDNMTKAPVYLARSLEKALEFCNKTNSIEQIFVGGGPSLYSEAIAGNLIDRFHITNIDADHECDTFFPKTELYNLLKAPYINRTTDIQYIKDNNVDLQFSMHNINYINNQEREYQNLLNRIVSIDQDGRSTRNSVTHSLFGEQLEFNLSNSFPLLTTKKMYWKGVVEELLFFLRGETDTNTLSNKGVRIWEANTSRQFLDSRGLFDHKVGEMRNLYSENWRRFGATNFDQLADVIHKLRFDPTSRRIMMTTFDPSVVSQAVLAPCHGIVTQFYVDLKTNSLDCSMYQRSADCFLGLPFNIASYSLLMEILGRISGYKPRRLIINLGDAHIYKSHLAEVDTQLDRRPYMFPTLDITKEFLPNDNFVESAIKYIEALQLEDFKLNYYRCWPSIKADMVA
jgi:dihydrofolate reductase/thymidylate synthase